MNNIKIQLLLFLMLLNSVSSLAQKNYTEGYIVKLNDDTLYGKVDNCSNLSLNQKPVKIRFIDARGEENGYKANEVKGYCLEGLETYVSIRDLNEGPFFAKVLTDGPVCLLVTHIKNKNATTFVNNSNNSAFVTRGNHQPNDRYFLINKSKATPTVEVNQLLFKKNIAGYFSDCAVLKRKIEEKELRFDDLEIIVKKYNECSLEK